MLHLDNLSDSQSLSLATRKGSRAKLIFLHLKNPDEDKDGVTLQSERPRPHVGEFSAMIAWSLERSCPDSRQLIQHQPCRSSDDSSQGCQLGVSRKCGVWHRGTGGHRLQVQHVPDCGLRA